jgi:hypothetical protein
MMNWLLNNVFCLACVYGRNHSVHKSLFSIDKHVESGYDVEASDPPGNCSSFGGASGGASGSASNASESDLDDLEDDSEWLASASSFSDVSSKTRNTVDGASISEDQVINVLVKDASREGSDSSNSHSRKSMSSVMSTKSILIGESSNKNIDAKNKRGSRFYPDVDSEKFVRFGT